MKRDERHVRGQSLVEFGRAWMTKNILTGAAREAVRMYAVIPYDNSLTGAPHLRAENILTSAGLDISRSTIEIYSEDLPGNADPNDDLLMRTDVTYNFPVIIVGLIPGLPSNNIPLATSTTMRKE